MSPPALLLKRPQATEERPEAREVFGRKGLPEPTSHADTSCVASSTVFALSETTKRRQCC
jgi:hypothetical protein